MRLNPLAATLISLGLGTEVAAKAEDSPPKPDAKALHRASDLQVFELAETKITRFKELASSFEPKVLRQELNDLVSFMQGLNLLDEYDAQMIKQQLIGETNDDDLIDLAGNVADTFNADLVRAKRAVRELVSDQRRIAWQAKQKVVLIEGAMQKQIISPEEAQKLEQLEFQSVENFVSKAEYRKALVSNITSLGDALRHIKPKIYFALKDQLKAVAEDEAQNREINKTIQELRLLEARIVAALRGAQLA